MYITPNQSLGTVMEGTFSRMKYFQGPNPDVPSSTHPVITSQIASNSKFSNFT